MAAVRRLRYTRLSRSLMQAEFEQLGWVGLLRTVPGQRRPMKLSPEMLAFAQAHTFGTAGPLAAEFASELAVALVASAPARERVAMPVRRRWDLS